MPGRVVVSTPANGRQRWDAPAVGKVKNAYGSRDQPGEAFGDSVRWAGGGKVVVTGPPEGLSLSYGASIGVAQQRLFPS